jgi:transposase-like protein
MEKFKTLEIVVDSCMEALECPECGADQGQGEDGYNSCNQGVYHYKKGKRSPYSLYKCSNCGYKFLVDIED